MRPIESGFHFPSTSLSSGRTIWIADAHRDDGKRYVVHAGEKRFVVPANEKLSAFVELETAIHPYRELI